jgi:hypothetical protein
VLTAGLMFVGVIVAMASIGILYLPIRGTLIAWRSREDIFGAGAAFGAGPVDRRRLTERADGGAVHVQVLQDDELGLRCSRGVEHGCLEGRELLGASGGSWGR